jgi:hypothetical protein
MNPNGRPPEPPDFSRFNENRTRFPVEQLAPYAGQYVAWTPDGTRIVACAADRAGLYQRLQEIGVHYSQVVFGYIDPF